MWAGLCHGLQYDALAYNSFAVSTLSFVAQLESPPDWVLKREREALGRIAVGPKNWCTAEDLWNLKSAYGLPQSFTSLAWTARASQLRVYLCDPATADKQHLQTLVGQIGALMAPDQSWGKRGTG